MGDGEKCGCIGLITSTSNIYKSGHWRIWRGFNYSFFELFIFYVKNLNSTPRIFQFNLCCHCFDIPAIIATGSISHFFLTYGVIAMAVSSTGTRTGILCRNHSHVLWSGTRTGILCRNHSHVLCLGPGLDT